MASSMQLDPTRLGNKSHWDEVYKEEIGNFDEFGDEGEVWFGQDTTDKMVQWITDNVPPNRSQDTESNGGPAILDIGTGNGILPICLAEAGYDPRRLAGIDYSDASVDLARRVSQTRGFEEITFEAFDFIKEIPERMQSKGILHQNVPLETKGEDISVGSWDLLLDKGTFDAISLSSGSASLNKAKPEIGTTTEPGHPTDLYPVQVEALLKPGGYFLITSCNFTEDEIKNHFTSKAPSLQFHSRVKHPTISFGGKTGATYSTVALQKQKA
ncbi:S-adenosyl-L-methionine-dependent methyltransferase [Serendipita vermifera]|nr:S-adenosyl-L-methionine-dependent methyltransferase [Serendipita vermifera]